jgi:hypothetical protein
MNIFSLAEDPVAGTVPELSLPRPERAGQQRLHVGFGNTLPGATTNFGRNNQYGALLSSSHLIFGGGGASHNLFNNFRGVIANPCPAAQNQQGQQG